MKKDRINITVFKEFLKRFFFIGRLPRKYDNLPTIQIPLTIKNLTIYYHQVKENLFDFPDFSQGCPVCGAPDCAVRKRFYNRQAVDEFGTFFKALPIAVFLCHGRSKRNGPHKYFSLLPHMLIPYRKYSIGFVMNTAEERFVNNLTYDRIFDKLDLKNLNFCPATLRGFFSLITFAIEKLLVSKYAHNLPDELFAEDVFSRIKAFLEFSKDFLCCKTNLPIRGPCALAFDFYLSLGGYASNAQFLFGTPSQFRKKI